MRFVDTNVFLYAAISSLEDGDADKRRRAREVMESDLALSVQVLQEFYHQATRPTRARPLTHVQALEFLENLLNFPIQEMTLDLFHDAVTISERFGISYWDGAILAAARSLGCDAVYTEDLNDEQEYDGLRVINPFAGV